MRLLEIIPQTETDSKLVEFLMDFGDITLGKQTVLQRHLLLLLTELELWLV